MELICGTHPKKCPQNETPIRSLRLQYPLTIPGSASLELVPLEVTNLNTYSFKVFTTCSAWAIDIASKAETDFHNKNFL